MNREKERGRPRWKRKYEGRNFPGCTEGGILNGAREGIEYKKEQRGGERGEEVETVTPTHLRSSTSSVVMGRSGSAGKRNIGR